MLTRIMLTQMRIAFFRLMLVGMSVLSAHTTQASPAAQTVPPFPPLCVVPTGTVGWYEISADAIGIHTETLWIELAKGQSIADVAAANASAQEYRMFLSIIRAE